MRISTPVSPVTPVTLVVLSLLACRLLPRSSPPLSAPFSGPEAFRLLTKQLEFGPRIPGSPASIVAGDWILDVVRAAGWETQTQSFQYAETPLRNLVATSSQIAEPPILLGAHYDTRPLADRDSVAPSLPVPGANDGASGVAILLELARVLDRGKLPFPVWLVFFDAEDSGGIQNWEWIVGSQHFASTLSIRPRAVIVVDMVGDADLQLYLEGSSDPSLAASLWSLAAEMGYTSFVEQPGRTILDDHVPFRQLGIPSVDIIDINYPYWHTTQDTADKISPASLEQVGRVLEAWLYRYDVLPTQPVSP